MLSFYTSNSKFKLFVVTLVLSFFILGGLNFYFFNQKGFLKLAGNNTLEAQVERKLSLLNLAFETQADVLLVGSSFVRYGIATKPFVQSEILTFNLGVSSLGPISQFYINQKIVEKYKLVSSKPVVVLEVKPETFFARPQYKNFWSEFETVIFLSRNTSNLYKDYWELFSLYKRYGLESQLLTALILPSLVYRPTIARLIEGRKDEPLEVEDVFGYSPIKTELSVEKILPFFNRGNLSDSDLVSKKVSYFLNGVILLCEQGFPIVLFESPMPSLNPDTKFYDEITELTLHKCPQVKLFRTKDLMTIPNLFERSDTGHPNNLGSQKIAEKLSSFLLQMELDLVKPRESVKFYEILKKLKYEEFL